MAEQYARLGVRSADADARAIHREPAARSREMVRGHPSRKDHARIGRATRQFATAVLAGLRRRDRSLGSNHERDGDRRRHWRAYGCAQPACRGHRRAGLQVGRRHKAIGFGINLQPNAVRELIELGLGEALAETAIETAELGYYNKLGQLIWSEPRGLRAGYAWPQYAIERGDLQMILLDAVKARIGADNILTGHHLISFEQDGSGVTAHFIERPSGRRLSPARSDVLIGCDGIHSAVRAQLYPEEGPPVGSGRIQWRGVVEAEPFLDGRTHATMGFSDQRAVVYPMSRKAADRGRSRISWVVTVPAFISDRRDTGAARPPTIWSSSPSSTGISVGSILPG